MELELRVAIHGIFIVERMNFAPGKKALCQAKTSLLLGGV
jgi:hypothetical protein